MWKYLENIEKIIAIIERLYVYFSFKWTAPVHETKNKHEHNWEQLTNMQSEFCICHKWKDRLFVMAGLSMVFWAALLHQWSQRST